MKLLILDDFDNFPELASKIKEIKKDLEIIYVFNKKGELDKSLLNKHLPSSEIIIVGKFNKEMLSKSRNLQWLHSTSAGVDKLLFPELIKSNVLLTNSRGIHPIPIAEHVFAAILCFQRRFKEHILNQERKQWVYKRSEELYGKTLCIIGVGNIGKRIAFLAKAFGCKTIGIKRSLEKIKHLDEIYSIKDLNKAIPKADYIILCLPSTSKTKNIISEPQLRLMKSSAILINIGRGSAINDEALIHALKSKQIAGAALDVFKEEPLPSTHPYYSLDKIIITPHHSGSTLEYDKRSVDIFCNNLRAFLNKKPMPTLVNKKEGY